MLLSATFVSLRAQLADGLKDFPKFKGEVFQVALYNYVQNYYQFCPNEREYHPVIRFEFNDDGSLSKAEILRSTGSPSLDRSLLCRCKDFAHKKFMTPAYSEDGPVACVVEMQLDFHNIVPRDFSYPKNEDMGYSSSQPSGWMIGVANTINRQVGTMGYAGYYNPSNNYQRRSR